MLDEPVHETLELLRLHAAEKVRVRADELRGELGRIGLGRELAHRDVAPPRLAPI
jgi:hypothetical protein